MGSFSVMDTIYDGGAKGATPISTHMRLSKSTTTSPTRYR